MTVQTLLLPDRNVVDVIKTAVSGNAQKGVLQEEMLARLRQWDTPAYAFSPLLSLIEGEHGREDSATEKAAAQIKESAAFRQFFRFAFTDSDYLDSACEVFAATFAGVGFKEGKSDARAELLAQGAPLVADLAAPSKMREIEGSLIELSDSMGLDRGDAMLVLLLACLYGNDDARKVLKPTKQPRQAFNVLNDIHLIPRIGIIKAVVAQFSAMLNVRLITLDGGLEGVLKMMRLARCRVGPEGDLQMQLRYLPGLFPKLDSDAAIALLRRVNGEIEEAQEGGES